jgi:hypothetical protein
MADFARTRLRVDVDTGSFAAFESEAQAFDAVTMWDYIEHSNDPRGDLRRAAALLAPSGLLAVSTGDVGSLAARVFKRRWHLLTPRHHNFFFTRSSLERAFRDAGFEVLETSYPWSRYSVHYLLHKLRTIGNVGLLQRISTAVARTRLGGLAVPVNLFDVVTVVGRRAGA